jgi:hypothetical protein
VHQLARYETFFDELPDDVEPRSQSIAPGRVSLTSRLHPRTPLHAIARALEAGELRPQAARAVNDASASSGAPLPSALRTRIAPALGGDLADVRIHTGAASARAARALDARAYTIGNDVHFADGAYAPADPFGMHLIAHEAAHTIQQASGPLRVQCKRDGGPDGGVDEQAADAGADAAVAPETSTAAAPGAKTDDARVQALIDQFLKEAGYDKSSPESPETYVEKAYSRSESARNADEQASQDLNLAAASHYLMCRSAVVRTPVVPAPVVAVSMALATVVYEGLKGMLQAAGSNMYKSGAGKPSKASGFVMSWGLKGTLAGLADWAGASGKPKPGKGYDTPVEPGERQPGGVAPENSRADN